MSVYAGPEIVSDSLVFAYDMINTQKSFKGAPTTNMLEAYPITSWTGSAGSAADISATGEIYNGGVVYRLSDADGVNPNTYVDNYILRNSFANLTLNDQYTLSMDIKVIQKSNVSNSGAANNGIWIWYAGNSEVVNFKDLTLNVWTRIKVTATVGATYNYLMPRIDYDNSIVEVANLQFEKQSFSTPFTNNTRSNTQAILDLTGINTITTNSLTYASNNTFSFNGTSNYLRPTISHSYLLPSAIEVIFNSTSHGTGYKTIAGYRHNGGYSFPTIGSIYLNGNTLSATLIGVTDVYRTVTSSVSIAQNTNYHVVFNKDTVNGTMQLYVNGALVGTQTFTAANYAQWPSLGSYVGANILDIGKSSNTDAGQGWSADYFSGTIYGLKVYNKVLSATEIQQNFNATRSRYGI